MQTFVVQRLACFEDPTTVAAAVAVEFNVEITRQSVEGYDPTKRAGANLSPKWRALFDETRRAFLNGSAAIGIAHKVVRLREIERLMEKATQQETCSLWQNCSSRPRASAGTPTRTGTALR